MRWEILPPWRVQDILAYGAANRPAGDLAGDAFLDTVRRAGQIQLAPSNPSPFFRNGRTLPPGVAPFTASVGRQPLLTHEL